MSFAPVYDDRSRALILGTWPSPKSREMAFYYGHPQNRFWPLLAALTGEPLPAREDIAAKKQLLLRHGLALWDTLESCTITGASDASIRDVVPNDIAGLLRKAPIRAVFCNGATAYRIYTKYQQPLTGIPAVRLTYIFHPLCGTHRCSAELHYFHIEYWVLVILIYIFFNAFRFDGVRSQQGSVGVCAFLQTSFSATIDYARKFGYQFFVVRAQHDGGTRFADVVQYCGGPTTVLFV